MVSDEIPILFPFTGEELAVEDSVLCVFTSTGDGYCLAKIEEGE